MENISGFENVTISNGGVSSNRPVTTTERHLFGILGKCTVTCFVVSTEWVLVSPCDFPGWGFFLVCFLFFFKGDTD